MSDINTAVPVHSVPCAQVRDTVVCLSHRGMAGYWVQRWPFGVAISGIASPHICTMQVVFIAGANGRMGEFELTADTLVYTSSARPALCLSE